MNPTTQRDHGLDALRGLMMSLGIVIHTIIAYTTSPVLFWPVNDEQRTPIADLGIVVIHQFRMQVFFFLAGYFAAILAQKYGIVGLIRHRVKRLVIPFIISLLTIAPLLMLLWIYLSPQAASFVLQINLDVQDWWNFTKEFISSGDIYRTLQLFHLWFLYYLILILGIHLLLRQLLRLSPAINNQFEKWFTILLTSRFRWLILMALLQPALWHCMVYFIDTPDGWIVRPQILVYYYIFFAMGWFLHHHRELLTRLTQGWKTKLILGQTVLFALFMVGFMLALQRSNNNPYIIYQYTDLKLLSLTSGALSTWLILFGLIGLFQAKFQQSRAKWSYLAESAYWMYLVHLLAIIPLQALLADFTFAAEIKISIISITALVILLFSYHLFVRSTWLGILLNGKRISRQK